MGDNLVNDNVLVGKDPIPETLFMYLVDGVTNDIIDSIPIGLDGIFSFPSQPVGSHRKLLLTNQFIGIGQNAPASGNLPTYWEFTGENDEYNNGLIGDDGTPDGLLDIPVIGTANLTGLNFGIRITPEPPHFLYYLANNINLSTGSLVESNYATGTYLDTTIQTNFGVGTPGQAAVLITYTRMGVYLQESIFVDKTSATTFWNDIKNWMYANNFTDLTYDGDNSAYVIQDYVDKTYIAIQQNYISGNVFHDPNAMTDNLVNDSRSFVVPDSVNQVDVPAGLRANLISVATGLVVKSALVSGLPRVFKFSSNATPIPSGQYQIQLTQLAGTVGQLPPATQLHTGWTNTGENVGTGTGSDGVADSFLTINFNGTITNANFGIKWDGTS